MDTCFFKAALRFKKGAPPGFTHPAQLLYQIHNDFVKVRPHRSAAQAADEFALALLAAPAIAELPFVLMQKLGKGREAFADVNDKMLSRILREVTAVARIDGRGGPIECMVGNLGAASDEAEPELSQDPELLQEPELPQELERRVTMLSVA